MQDVRTITILPVFTDLLSFLIFAMKNLYGKYRREFKNVKIAIRRARAVILSQVFTEFFPSYFALISLSGAYF